MEECNLSVVCL